MKKHIILNKTIFILIISVILFSYYNISKAVEISTSTSQIDLEEENDDLDIKKIERDVIETGAKTEKIDLDSRIALIYDRASGRILYDKNGNKQTPMASTTKIMTAIVVLENANLKDVVTIDSKAAGIGGSRLGLKKNDKITVNDLLYGLMLRSGNDAAVALANYVGGSVQGFADMMNKKAQELGLVNTHFVVPHGLDNEGHFTTAYELAKMADYALENEKFKQIVTTQNTTIHINNNAKNINNTNKLLGSVSGVYGVKTGFTNGAGRCLVASCKRDDLDIITVVIGANTNKQRTSDTIKLIQYANEKFDICNVRDIVESKFKQWQDMNESRIYVDKGVKNEVKLYIESMTFEKMAVPKEKMDSIEIDLSCLYNLEAPVQKDQVIGNVKVVLNDEIVEVLEIRVKEEVRKREVMDYLKMFATIVMSP